MPKRSIIYVDGFNFYYGLLRNTPYKWLNLQKLFERIRQDDEIQKIWYFISRTSGSAGDRQEVYLRALSTQPQIGIIFGKFKHMTRRCLVRECAFHGSREFEIQVEKRTDVNIAVQILDDAYKDLADRIVLVSGDSDLVPALAKAKERFPEKRLIVYVPAHDPVRGAATEIRQVADKHSTIDINVLKHCQFPDPLLTSDGRIIRKPASW